MRNLRLSLVVVAMMSMSLMAGDNAKPTQSYGAWLLQNAADWQSQMTKL